MGNAYIFTKFKFKPVEQVTFILLPLDYFPSRNKLDRSGEITKVWITCDFSGMEQTAKNHWA